jgi:hypothetical protein
MPLILIWKGSTHAQMKMRLIVLFVCKLTEKIKSNPEKFRNVMYSTCETSLNYKMNILIFRYRTNKTSVGI